MYLPTHLEFLAPDENNSVFDVKRKWEQCLEEII